MAAFQSRECLQPLLKKLETADGEQENLKALEEILRGLESRPLSYKEKEIVTTAIQEHKSRGLIKADHPIYKIAENRLSFTFLPKVCDLELAELDTGKKGKGSDGVGRGSSSSLVRTESEASHLDEMAAWAPSTIPTSTGVEDENCSDGGASTSYSGTYDVVKIMGNLSSFLLRPLPPDSQMQCIIQRLSPLKASFRLYLETFVINDQSIFATVRNEFEVNNNGINLRRVICGEEQEFYQPSSSASSSSSQPRCPSNMVLDSTNFLMEARKNKRSTTFQVTIYPYCAGTRGPPLGKLQQPASNLVTAASLIKKEIAIGTRACVRTSEKDRLLEVNAAIPFMRGNAQDDHTDIEAHLQALCSDVKLDGAFLLRNKPARWSAWQNINTLEFEGHNRVTEPSRKNIALVDVAELAEEAEGGGGYAWPFEKRSSYNLLQLGKVSEDRFSLDFRSPLSPFQAFSIAVSIFETSS